MPKPNYERLLAKSVTHMMDLLRDTAARTQGGTRSNAECIGCERTGVHRPELKCSCACHTARAFLADLMKDIEQKDAA